MSSLRLRVPLLFGLCLLFGAIFWTGAWLGVKRLSQHFLGDRAELAEAEALGRASSAKDCVDHSFERLDRCRGATCGFEGAFFLSVCLQHATPHPSLCRDVPELARIGDFEAWTRRQCAAYGQEQGFGCGQLLGVLQGYCESEPQPPA